MSRFTRPMRGTLLAVCLCLLAALSAAQDQRTYQPQVGQAGKDVVWVPTPDRLIERMLQMGDTTSKDVVVDLGSGDGRIPIAAAKKFGARAQLERDHSVRSRASGLERSCASTRKPGGERASAWRPFSIHNRL